MIKQVITEEISMVHSGITLLSTICQIFRNYFTGIFLNTKLTFTVHVDVTTK